MSSIGLPSANYGFPCAITHPAAVDYMPLIYMLQTIMIKAIVDFKPGTQVGHVIGKAKVQLAQGESPAPI
jgi:hypothetical protein